MTMEHRQEKRFSSYAKVVFLEQNKLGYLRDLNHLGCQIDFLEAPSLKINDQIVFQAKVPLVGPGAIFRF